MLDRGCTALQAVGQHGTGIGSGVEWTLASAGPAPLAQHLTGVGSVTCRHQTLARHCDEH